MVEGQTRENTKRSYIGSGNPAWKGGRHKHSRGYMIIYVPPVSGRGRGRYVMEHRLMWEKYNGPIPKGFIVHHLNGIKTDNRIENLVCIPTKRHDNLIPIYQKRIRELEAQIGA